MSLRFSRVNSLHPTLVTGRLNDYPHCIIRKNPNALMGYSEFKSTVIKPWKYLYFRPNLYIKNLQKFLSLSRHFINASNRSNNTNIFRCHFYYFLFFKLLFHVAVLKRAARYAFVLGPGSLV